MVTSPPVSPSPFKERGKDIKKRGVSPSWTPPHYLSRTRRVEEKGENPSLKSPTFSFKIAGTKRELKRSSAPNIFIGSFRGTKSLLPCYPPS